MPVADSGLVEDRVVGFSVGAGEAGEFETCELLELTVWLQPASRPMSVKVAIALEWRFWISRIMVRVGSGNGALDFKKEVTI